MTTQDCHIKLLKKVSISTAKNICPEKIQNLHSEINTKNVCRIFKNKNRKVQPLVIDQDISLVKKETEKESAFSAYQLSLNIEASITSQ